MSKKLLVLLLLSPITSNAMDEFEVKSIVENHRLTNEQKLRVYINQMNLPESFDPAIKEDISATDPEAQVKITRYAGMLLTEFDKESKHLSGQEAQDLEDVKKMLKELSRTSTQHYLKTVMQEENDSTPFLKMVGQRKQADTIETWNVFKTTSLITLDTIKRKQNAEISTATERRQWGTLE